MQFLPITTRAMIPPKDDLFSVLDESLMNVFERDVIMVTCKVLSLHQGRCVLKEGGMTRAEWGKRESDWYLDTSGTPESKNHIPTIKHHTFLGSAGVDGSNGKGYYILSPENPSELCREIWGYVREKFNISEVGVMAVDSHTLPFRYGVTSVSLGLFGFEPMRRYADAQDIFGNSFRETVNIADALASAGTIFFGEGNEQTPLTIVRNIPGLVFRDYETFSSLCVPPEKDIFSPLFRGFKKNVSKKFLYEKKDNA